MQRMCGDATIAAARAAKEAGVERFVFVSHSRVGSGFPSWLPMYGYFNGKERAEAAVLARYERRFRPSCQLERVLTGWTATDSPVRACRCVPGSSTAGAASRE